MGISALLFLMVAFSFSATISMLLISSIFSQNGRDIAMGGVIFLLRTSWNLKKECPKEKIP